MAGAGGRVGKPIRTTAFPENSRAARVRLQKGQEAIFLEQYGWFDGLFPRERSGRRWSGTAGR